MDSVYMRPSMDGQVLVTVFGTNVTLQRDAQVILELLARKFPDCQFNFDIWDCDHVFRMESKTDVGDEVMRFFGEQGFLCELLK